MRKSIALLLSSWSLLLANSAMAWGSAGHEVIAAEAYQQLSPELKAEVFEVLKAHPDYARWANSYHPNANFDLPAYVFMRSSTWPDEIRRSGNYAIELEAKYPRASLPELAADTTPKSWSLESRELAIEKGYLHGKLIGSTERDSAPKLPPDYLKNAKLVAEKQGALAGYRLADEIAKYLKCGGLVPLLPTNTFVASAITLPTKIGALEASKYYDETMTVTGKVEQVTVRSTVTILDVDGAGRSAPFTAVIFSANAGAFGDAERFNNQNVEIKGAITEYRNKPEIILELPGQIKVVGGN